VKVLVTGSAGFVGSAFAKHYLRAGHDVRLVDLKTDLDCRFFFQAYPDQHFDIVIHCAAVVGGRTMINGQPLLLATEDLSIDAAMFQWALTAKPGRIVYFSSSAAYPPGLQTYVEAPKHGPLRESDYRFGQADATYGMVKQVGERLAAEAVREGLKVHILRPFSGYGEMQALDYPLPAFAQRAARRDDPFEIWGDRDSVRDWIHIDDIVGATLAIMDAEYFETAVNLCTGRGVAFYQLASAFARRAGYQPKYEYARDKPMGVHTRVGSPDLMHQFYVSRITLEEGIARALVHYEQL
jgi:nucleoside-diphosphate-sugar epimerase